MIPMIDDDEAERVRQNSTDDPGHGETEMKAAKIMPWGKYRGWPFEDIGESYLRWLLEDAVQIRNNPRLKREIEAELRRRSSGKQPNASAEHPGVAAWRSAWPKLVRLAHPEMGGSHELMIELNRVNEAMKGTTP